MDLLTYILGGLGIGGVVTAVVVLSGFGMAPAAVAFAWFRDSKLAQAFALAAVAVLGLLALRRDGVNAGKAEAMRDVHEAHERAVESKRSIDRDVVKLPMQRKRDELGRWARGGRDE